MPGNLSEYTAGSNATTALQALLKRSSDIIIMLSDTGYIVEFNGGAEKIFDKASFEVLGQNWFQFVESDHFPQLFSKNDFPNLPDTDSLITELNHIHNPARIVDWNISTIKIDQNQQLVLLIGKDITSFRNNEKKLHDANLYLQYVINNVPHSIIWKDKNSVFLGCNKVFAESVGFDDPKDIVGKTDYDLPWTKEESDAYRADDQLVMRTQNPKLNIEEPQTLDDGGRITLLTSKVPLKDERGEVTGVLGIYTDITKQKDNEEKLYEALKAAEAANELKTQFLAVVSHELRTPLNGIIGISDILSTQNNDEKTQQLIAEIKYSGNALKILIEDILGFTRLEGKNTELVFDAMDIRSLLNNLLDNMKFLKGEKRIDLSLNLDESIPRWLLCDGLRLQQVLSNLIGNAIKFTDSGSVVANIKFLSESADMIKLRFQVKDTGIGIPNDQLKNIFVHFTQVAGSGYARQHGGLGLGLAIAERLINLMGSTILVTSGIGQGSTFWFDLELQKSKQGWETTIGDSKTKPCFSGQVLVVEDNELNQKVMALMLDSLGVSYQIVDEGNKVEPALAQSQYDLILMDVQLPDRDGPSVTAELRKTAKYKNMPIIGVTAHAYPEMIESFKKSGMDDVLTKPVTIDNISELLKRYMNTSKG